MDDSTQARACRCLCGEVAFEAIPEDGIGACHCGTCRGWGGGPFLAVSCGASVMGTDAKAIATYASSEWAERAFCRSCGTHLWYHLLPGAFSVEGQYIVSVGLFEDQRGMDFDHEVYVDGNPGWYEFAGADARKRMTEQDILDMVAASEEGKE